MKKVLFIIALTAPYVVASANAEIRCHWNEHCMSSNSAAIKQLSNSGYEIRASAQAHKVLVKLFIGDNYSLSNELHTVDQIAHQDSQFLGCSAESFSVIP